MSKKKKNPSFKRKDLRRVQSKRLRRGGPVEQMTTGVPLSDADFEAFKTYLDAHWLLPNDFEGDKPAAFPLVQEAFSIVDDRGASPEALLRAVVVLGHTPTVAALDVLRRHASTERPHAAVARFAADECLDWIAHANTRESVMN